MSTSSSKKNKYERIICEGLPFFKDATGKLYLWENNGSVVDTPIHIGQLSECGERIIINKTEETENNLAKKLAEWRESQSSRTREQIRRPDAIATINPGAITADEAASMPTDDTVPKKRTRKSKKSTEPSTEEKPPRKRRTTKEKSS